MGCNLPPPPLVGFPLAGVEQIFSVHIVLIHVVGDVANIVFFNYRFLSFLHGSTWLVHTSCLVPLFPTVFLQWKNKSSHESLQPSSKIKSWPIRHLNNYFPPGSYFPLSLISESLRLNSLSQNGPRKGHDSNFNATKSVLCIFVDVNIFFSAYRKYWRVFL